VVGRRRRPALPDRRRLRDGPADGWVGPRRLRPVASEARCSERATTASRSTSPTVRSSAPSRRGDRDPGRRGAASPPVGGKAPPVGGRQRRRPGAHG
jgi:hypothetical protein